VRRVRAAGFLAAGLGAADLDVGASAAAAALAGDVRADAVLRDLLGFGAVGLVAGLAAGSGAAASGGAFSSACKRASIWSSRRLNAVRIATKPGSGAVGGDSGIV
jgi:hypothetical protein